MSILVVPVNGAKPIKATMKATVVHSTGNRTRGSITLRCAVNMDFSVPAPSADEKAGILMALREDDGAVGFAKLDKLIRDISKELKKPPHAMKGKTDLGRTMVFPRLIETDRKLIIKDSSGSVIIGSISVEGEGKLNWDSPKQLKAIHTLLQKMVSSGWKVKKAKPLPLPQNYDDYFEYFTVGWRDLERVLSATDPRKLKNKNQVLSFIEKFVVQAMVKSDADWGEFFSSVHEAYREYENTPEYVVISERVFEWWEEGNE